MTGGVLPDLVLPSHSGEHVKVSSLPGPVGALLVFFPYAFTPVCADELAELADLTDGLRTRGIELVAASCDTKFVLRAWSVDVLSDKWDSVLLLSDFWPHGALARACGVFDSRRGGPHRTALLTDRTGAFVDSEAADFGTKRNLRRFLESPVLRSSAHSVGRNS